MWATIELEPERIEEVDFGPLRVWIRRTRTTWQFARAHIGDPDVTSEQERAWTTFVPASGESTVFFQPAMPDRPVVVHTENPLEFAPGARYLLFTSVPLWIRAWIGSPGRQLLFDIPTVTLSNTWFGGTTSGRLCYTSPASLARHSHDVGPQHPGAEAICPIRVMNRAPGTRQVYRLAILTEMLRVYRSGGPQPPSRPSRRADQRLPSPIRSEPGQLWTNEALINYTGDDDLNVTVSEKPPLLTTAAELLCPPRVTPSENFVRKGIGLLRGIGNY